MRISDLRCVVKGDISIEFVEQDITSYSGLELVRRYFYLLDLDRRVRDACRDFGLRSDYGCGLLVLVVLVLLVVGAGLSPTLETTSLHLS